MDKVLGWIKNVGIGCLVLLVVLSLVGKFKKSDYIVGFAPMKVLSGSMEPTIKVGDLIMVRKLNASNIKVGDIITYKMGSRTNVTHRVVEVSNVDNDISFKTKGDANNIEDSELVWEDNLVGKLTFRIPKFGYLIDFIQNPFGFLLLFIIPVIVLLRKEKVFPK